MASDTQDQGPSAPPFYFLVTFWGRKYRDWFLKFTVASLLAPGNAPALDDLPRARFLIATTREDWDALFENPNFRQLAALVKPELLEFPPESAALHKYFRMSLGHKMLTQACFHARAVGINLNPDTLVPDGCLAEAQRIVKGGCKVVMCTAVRFDLDAIEAELRVRGRLADDRPAVVSRREAVEIGLRNFHSETRAGNWDAAHFGELGAMHGKNHYPICCYWQVPQARGVYILTHNWAPFAINYARFERHNTETFAQWTLDGDYIFANLGEAAEIGRDVHVVTDSDSIFLLGMTPADDERCPAPFYWWKSLPVLGRWAKGFLLNRVVYDYRGVDPLRRRIYPLGARWHQGDLDEAWAPVLRRAGAIVRDYLERDLDVGAEAEGRPAVAIAGGRLKRHFPRIWWYRIVRHRLMEGRMLFPSFLPGFRRFLSIYVRAVWLSLRGDANARGRIRSRLMKLVGLNSGRE